MLEFDEAFVEAIQPLLNDLLTVNLCHFSIATPTNDFLANTLVVDLKT